MWDPFATAFLKAARPGWQPPSSYDLSNSLLDKTQADITVLNNITMAKDASVTIQLDEWSDVNSTSLINVAIYAGYPIFWKSVNPGATRHTREYIAGIIGEAIDTAEFGAKIQAGVTDNPSTMKAAWQKRPGVTCYGCAAHILNLLANDFRSKITTVGEVFENNKKSGDFF